ncbi:hypothetical protein [Terriglobus albidus]|uniref:hypothetical protein n=1 Tax=Terriglobus albidus TaxID=1592106 RepID=UPI0021DFE938|nr:hypothetical protein [Terriglobus albidus]
MRPKKNVLLFHPNPAEAGRLQFIFETRLFVLMTLVSDVATLASFLRREYDSEYHWLVMVYREGADLSAHVELIANRPETLKLLEVLPEPCAFELPTRPDRVAVSRDMAGIQLAMNTLLARKRGPKKPILMPVPPPTAAIEERATA